MHPYELEYTKLVQECLASPDRNTRNGLTRSLFGYQLKVNLADGFPLLVGRKMFYKGVFGELAAILRGPKHINDFKKWGCNYWDQWAAEDGSINVDYGNAWLDYNGVNQLEELRNALKNDPTSRRMIINGWRPDRLKDLSLPCCHYGYQFYVNDNVLSMVWIQRSVDVMVGLPSDVAFAAAMVIMIANEFGFEPGVITMQLGDCHVYNEHIEGAKQYIDSVYSIAKTTQVPSYTLYAPAGTRFETFEPDFIGISNYHPFSSIKFLLKE